MPSRCCISVTALIASLNDMPGCRLNDTVTDGNELVWLSTAAWCWSDAEVTAESGVTPWPAGIEIDILEAFRALPIRRRNFKHHVILIQLRINDGNFRLPKCAVERLIDETAGVSPSRAAVTRS